MPGSGIPYQPERGHFIWLNFSPQAGTEQAERRPALVLSPRIFNVATGLALVCPITNARKGGPFEVALPLGGKPSGVLLADHVRSLNWIVRQAAFIGVAAPECVDEVCARIAPVLGL